MTPEKNGHCIVLCTCPTDDDTDRLAQGLVEARLAACVQIMPIRSVYTWKGEIHRDEERLLLIKARTALYPLIEDFITRNHPYEVPEIVRVPVEDGLEKYLNWIDSVSRE
ncbi:MAG TPA: divalent-cation tolerance protein CutA [Deltaproteobacteria bacterium]|nr:divalent-cation tolerance protein CutA [Deltaproteobacteria bacterium]